MVAMMWWWMMLMRAGDGEVSICGSAVVMHAAEAGPDARRCCCVLSSSWLAVSTPAKELQRSPPISGALGPLPSRMTIVWWCCCNGIYETEVALTKDAGTTQRASERQ